MRVASLVLLFTAALAPFMLAILIRKHPERSRRFFNDRGNRLLDRWPSRRGRNAVLFWIGVGVVYFAASIYLTIET
jgi:hypothetical protein